MRASSRLLPMLALCERGWASFPIQFSDAIKPCPVACGVAMNPGVWTVYHNTERLSICDLPVLLSFNLYTPIDDPATDLTIRACTLGDPDSTDNSLQRQNFSSSNAEKSNPELTYDNAEPISTSRLNRRNSSLCGVSVQSTTTAQLSWWDTQHSGSIGNAVDAVEKIQEYLQTTEDCGAKTIFSYLRGSLAGMYFGRGIEKRGAASTFVQKFIDHIKSGSTIARQALQVCGEESSSEDIIGIFADTNANFSHAQQMMKGWNDAKCVSGADGTTVWKDTVITSLREPPSTILQRSTYLANYLNPRATCRYIRVNPGDGCAKLASRCGITAAAFTSYNKKSNLCSTLTEGQPVCCSSGTLPDLRPKPGANGVCATHSVKSEEYCQLIASRNGLELKDLDEFNKQTWGWSGCKNLQEGLRICLSKGKPPMPAPVQNAKCGPLVPGTAQPPDGKSLADLNPCVLNVCCNIWGQCGTTEDFCTKSKSETGNPGTAAPGKYGCISNCGMDVVNNKQAPAEFKKVGYFEAWNFERECLKMHVGRIDKSYTHVHFSFAEISPDMQVRIPKNLTEQWKYFIKGTTHKKILAFGGWSFSTDYDTAPIFAQSVSAEKRTLFAERVVKFAVDNKLDGLDFDWEYPGAEDLTVGHKDDGKNYLAFLKVVRSKMPKGMSLSIAAPASFWYLKGFPIKDMASVLDYIIYMTYDLHGQWDAGSAWANPGCPSGSCLRSHVNYTETYNALTMITKAGVPSHKVIVGVSSYGRSFKMSRADCRGPQCTFLGDRLNSPAKGGRCTKTGGYISNAEIDEIIDKGGAIQRWRDNTDSDYLIYEGTEWVAYMSDSTKNSRTAKYKSLNFGGTSDWAVDLQKFLLQAEDPNGYDPDPKNDELYPICDKVYTSFEDLEKANVPTYCGPFYVISLLRRVLNKAMIDYDKIIADGYDKYFNFYADYVVSTSGEALNGFLENKGKDYFTCNVIEKITCCRQCHYKLGDKSKECQHCTLQMCEKISSAWDEPAEWHNVSEPCPPDMSKRGVAPKDGGHQQQSIFWTLRESKKDAFWADVTAEVGAPQEKMPFRNRATYGARVEDRECGFGRVWAKESCHYENNWFNVPVLKDFQRNDVVNPKDDVKKALETVGGLKDGLDVMELEMRAGQFDGVAEDVVDAVALPVFMVEESIKSMQHVAELGKDLEEQEKKALIMMFLMAVFFIMPAVGSVVGSLGFSTLGRVLMLLGEAGSLGQGIYDVVEDPESAPFLIFSLIMGANGLRDVGKVAKAARARRSMTTEQIGKLGPGIQGRLNTIDKVVDRSGWAPAMCKL